MQGVEEVCGGGEWIEFQTCYTGSSSPGEDAVWRWKCRSGTAEKYSLKHVQHLRKAEATGMDEDMDEPIGRGGEAQQVHTV